MRTLSRRQLLSGMSCCALAPSGTGAQAPGAASRRHTADERYALFRKNLVLRGTAITENQFRGISGLTEWRGRRDTVRQQFLDSLGLDPLPARTPLNVKATGGFDKPRYTVENILFES